MVAVKLQAREAARVADLLRRVVPHSPAEQTELVSLVKRLTTQGDNDDS